MMMQFDSGLIKGVQETSEGFLKLTGTLASVGWLEYRDNKNNITKQYVPKETLFDQEHLDSISGSILTMDHPNTFVNPSNYSKYTVGTINSVLTEDNGDSSLINASITVYDAKAIRTIKTKKATGLSMGYQCFLETKDDGTIIQAKRICNHIAITPNPRCKVAKLHLDSNSLVMIDKQQKTDYRVFIFTRSQFC